jgi:hypothetical protein
MSIMTSILNHCLSAARAPHAAAMIPGWQSRATPLVLLLACSVYAGARGATTPVVTPQSSLSLGLLGPARVASDSQSRLFISDPLAGRVAVANVLGQLVQVKTNLGQPLGIAIDGAGRIYVGNGQSGAVISYDQQWTPIRQLGKGTGEFLLPGHIVTATSNGVTKVFVSDSLAHCVKVYQEGVQIGQFGSYGLGPNQFDFPAGLWLAADGTLFVVDQNNDRVQVLDQNGNFLRRFALRPSSLYGVASGRGQGITGDNQGRVYVADTFQGYLKVFDLAGNLLGMMSSFGDGLGQLQSPGGLAVDPQGRLWVADANNARVDGFCFVQPVVSPAALTVPDATNVSLTVSVGCSGGSFSYQWFKGATRLIDGGTVSGSTNVVLSLRGVTASDSGSYSVVVSNSTGAIASSPAQVTIVVRPYIIVPPADQLVPPGTNAILEVVAGGDSLSYQWLFNSVELAGQTAPQLLLTNVSAADNGIYTIRVSNQMGNASASAKFAMSDPPMIGAAPNENGDLVLTWNDPFSLLQSAPTPMGDWMTLLNATNPFTVKSAVILTNTAQFFRLVR